MFYLRIETPMELFGKHHRHLAQRLQPANVCKCMLSKGLLGKRDHTTIMNAPNDHIKNCMIIEYVRHQSSSYLFAFLDVLQMIEDQRYLYDTLNNGMLISCSYVASYGLL